MTTLTYADLVDGMTIRIGSVEQTVKCTFAGVPCTPHTGEVLSRALRAFCNAGMVTAIPTEPVREPYSIPTKERYFLDADGYCWREVSGLPVTDLTPDGVAHSMARINPDNSPTPQPYLYLTPTTDYDALVAERDDLRTEVEEQDREKQDLTLDLIRGKDERDRLAADLGAARTALRKYGRHQLSVCHIGAAGLLTCSCGLDAALDGLSRPTDDTPAPLRPSRQEPSDG